MQPRLRDRFGAHGACGIAAFFLLAAATADAASRINTLILSGRNNHDWRATTPHLRDLLDKTGRFEVRVTEEPSALTAQALARYDLLVLDYNGPRWGRAAEQAVESFVRDGKGLAVVHGAVYAFGDMELLGDDHVRTGKREAPWPEYAAMVGASWSDDAPKSGHAPRHVFKVTATDPEHAILRGLRAGGFEVSDELYHNLRTRPGVHAIASAYDDPAIGGTGKSEPMLWTVNYGKGRVFYTALGHDVSAMLEPGFIATFVRGAEWAASGEATIPAKLEPQAPSGSPRVLVVTGGHDHETTFYTMFESFTGMKVNVNPHPIAFNRDLRSDYDVLVLYDSVQTLDDKQKANLRAFVEDGGKGVVALHHAIVDFNDWEWWYRDVIGGSYLMKARDGHPASTYKHDEELRLTPKGTHPILKGIGPMHLWDETYKHLWISPEVNVLLTTDNPTSDGPVAWVSPYPKARVAFVQLGHGSTSHRHPGFRKLVENAILWSAGKLK